MPFNFRRKAYAQMLEWKSTLADRYALLIEGARRVGRQRGETLRKLHFCRAFVAICEYIPIG